MYAVIRRYEGLNTGSIEELTKRANEGFAPVVSVIPGFIAYYLVNAGNGVLVAIGIFQDEAEATESTRIALDWIKENLSDMLPSPPEITVGEVIVHRAK